MSDRSPRHCEEDSRLYASPTKQSVLLFWRASVLASLLSLLWHPAHATTIARIDVIWHDSMTCIAHTSIESAVRTAEGTQLSESRLNRVLESTLAHLAELGHHFAILAPRDFRTLNDSVSFTIDIDPGARTRIARWEVIGLTRTDSTWFMNALSLPTGVDATATVVRDALSRLSEFADVQLAGSPAFVETEPDSLVVVHIHLRESTPARFEGAVAAGSADGGEQALLGRFSLGLYGLFRRGHSFDIHYEHPQPREQLLRLNYSENRALWRNLSTHAMFEDWRRQDHRQRISTDAALSTRAQENVAVLLGLNWQKVTPLNSGADAARLYETSAGLSWRRTDAISISLKSTYSLHRQWEKSTNAELSQSRLRVDSEGRARINLPAMSSVRLTLGARWWGSGAEMRTGDEWFLGGNILSGYADRSIAASDGVWSRVEFSRASSSGFGVSLFGDLAWLSMFDQTYSRPSSLGLAVLLESPGRSGRLELAWRDHASLADGILRLSVVQGW